MRIIWKNLLLEIRTNITFIKWCMHMIVVLCCKKMYIITLLKINIMQTTTLVGISNSLRITICTLKIEIKVLTFFQAKLLPIFNFKLKLLSSFYCSTDVNAFGIFEGVDCEYYNTYPVI